MSSFTGNDGSGLVGGLNPSGQVKALSVDASGNLNVNATVNSGPTNLTQINSAAVSASNGLPVSGNNGGSLVVLDVDSSGRLIIGNLVQIGGTAPAIETQSGLAGAFITEDQIRNLIIAGKGYSVSTQKQTGFAGNGGFQFYNPSNGTKNILILSIQVGNAANVMFEMRKISADQSLLTGWTNQALTPTNLGASAVASTAVCGYSTTTVTGTFTGNYVRALTLNSNSEAEMLANGECIWLPAGAGSLAGVCLTWAETAVGFNINVFYLEF